MSETSNYRVNIGIRWVDETTPPAKKAKKGLDDVAKAAKALFGAAVVRQGVKFAVELAKIGATAERQANALNNLAAAAGTSGDAIVRAIQGASDFTIDKMGAMAAANRAMVMDVAKSPAEFERLTKVAVALGRAMGVDAAKSIDDFVTASGRQSKLIADNLGLVVNAEDAYKRYAEANNTTVDAMDDAAKKQAFLTEMLRQGEVKMMDLGDQALDAAGSMEQLGAATADAKTALGVIVSLLGQSTGIIPKLAKETRRLADGMQAVADAGGPDINLFQKAVAEGNKLGESSVEIQARYLALLRAESGMYDELGTEIGRYAYIQEQSAEIARYGHSQVAEAAAIEADAIENTTDAIVAMSRRAHDVNAAQESFMSTIPPVTTALEEESEAAKKAKDELLKLNESTIDIAQSNLSTASSYASYQKSVEESAANLAERREKIEADHADKITEIHKRGQAVALRFDKEAEQAKLADLQRRLEIQVQSESELSEKTKQSTRMRAEDRTATMRTQVAKQTQLLDDYEAGRLIKAGENVNALIAEEDRHYAESILGLEEAQAEQEASQKESLGRMVLQHFNAWVEMNLAADGFTKEEVKYITETRMQISEQYGMVTQAAIGEMEAQELEWKRTMAVMTGEAANFFDFFMQQFEAMPSEKVLTIRTELSERPRDVARQHGGPVRAGEAYVVGEGGPELFVPGSSGQIVSNSRAFDSHDTFNFNTPHGYAAVQESQRRQRRQRMGRVM